MELDENSTLGLLKFVYGIDYSKYTSALGQEAVSKILGKSAAIAHVPCFLHE